MKDDSHLADRVHPAAFMYAEEVAAGKLSRREFLTRSSALGVSAVAAYGLLGLAAPEAVAQETPVTGGTLRMNMETRALKDPRTWDWSELANFSRGWLEYLVEYERDGTIVGRLLESWSTNDRCNRLHAECPQGRQVEQWRRFHCRRRGLQHHPLVRWQRRRQLDGNPDGQPGRRDDQDSPRRRHHRAVTGPLTVKLTLPAPDIT
jgi:peptide/nickel transport system substrate-binding protein